MPQWIVPLTIVLRTPHPRRARVRLTVPSRLRVSNTRRGLSRVLFRRVDVLSFSGAWPKLLGQAGPGAVLLQVHGIVLMQGFSAGTICLAALCSEPRPSGQIWESRISKPARQSFG